MATTVGGHPVSAFTSPNNGDALDASVVKGNDNTLRSAYVAHDADSGVHLQSSTSTPTAGTAGAKWMVVNGSDVRVFYDNGTALVEIGYLRASASPVFSTLEVVGPSLLAAVNMQDNTLTRPVIKDYGETRTTPAISSGTLTLNLENGNVFGVALNANITTLTIQNPSASGTVCNLTVAFTADGTLRTITWPAAVKWAGGVSPTMTSTNGKVDILTFVTWDAGTNWYGFVAGQNF